MSTTATKPRGNPSQTHLSLPRAVTLLFSARPLALLKCPAVGQAWCDAQTAPNDANKTGDILRIPVYPSRVPNLSRWRKLEATQPPARESSRPSHKVTPGSQTP